MKKNIPNILTCANLIAGCVGIYYVLSGQEYDAIYFVLAGALFDLLDGLVARLLQVSSEIGKHLDSLADLVTFGVLPSFFLLKQVEGEGWIQWFPLLIAAFSAVRLARFNLDTNQSSEFIGLPTPANAIMLTSLIFLPFELNASSTIPIVAISSVLLISNIKLMALKFSHFRLKGNEFRWILIISTLVLFIVFQWTFIPFLIPSYVVFSAINNFLKKDTK
ncbi:MAG: CDP-diacylglycerol--serine O-phosphatidyltransferase [Bacteroidota bacterium]